MKYFDIYSTLYQQLLFAEATQIFDSIPPFQPYAYIYIICNKIITIKGTLQMVL